MASELRILGGEREGGAVQVDDLSSTPPAGHSTASSKVSRGGRGQNHSPMMLTPASSSPLRIDIPPSSHDSCGRARVLRDLRFVSALPGGGGHGAIGVANAESQQV